MGAGAQPGKALAVGPLALGAGTGVHQARPWPWGPVIELAQAQRWASTRQGPGLGAGAQPGKPQAVARPALGAGTGVHPAKPWQWWPVIELAQAQMLVLNQARPWPWVQVLN